MAGARGRDHAHAGGAGHRLRPVQPARQGFLTGAIDRSTAFAGGDIRNSIPRFSPEARAANQALVNLLGTVAARKNATPAQVALAWLLARKPWIVPIPGTRSERRLAENLGAADLRLSADDRTEIEDAAAKIQVQGDRYPAHLQQMIDR